MQLTQRQELASTMASAYVASQFDEAAKAFKTSPTALNWRHLKHAMTVLQAWVYHRKPSVSEGVPALLDKLMDSTMAQWDDLICVHVNGKPVAETVDLSA
jgi:hypothetical protein